MGFLLKTLGIFSITILVILFAPGIPPHVEFEYFELEPARKLEGKLAPNSILDKAEEVKLDRKIAGPESVVTRGDDVFTGIMGGELIRINKKGQVTTVMRNGKTCEGEWDNKNCGRIAGLRFAPDGKLLIADAAYGIFKVDVDTGDVQPIVTLDKPIEGKLPRFPDDLDVSKDGTIYWSDATTVGDVNNLLLEFLASPSGRLVKYDPKTKKNTVLLANIHFANGIQLSKDEDFVLVTETPRCRVLRYYLKGEKKGQSDVFVDRLPGLPDNVRPNGKGGFYIALINPRTPEEPSLVDIAGPFPLARKFVVRVYTMIISSLELAESFFPGLVFREWIAYARHLGPIGDLENSPYKTIIVETDGEGNILGSLQNEKGPMKGLSQITVGKEYTYFGSPGQKNLYRMKSEYLNK